MTHSFRSARLLGFALGAALLTAACSSSDRDSNATACPDIRLPDDASQVTRFRDGGAADLTDVAFQVRVTGTALNCVRGGGNDTVVDVAIGFEGARGPAATVPSVSVPYFVGVVGPGGQILNREAFAITLDIPNRQSLASVIDEIRVTIPVAEGRDIADYTVFAGLQLSAEELEFNRGTR